MRFGSTFGLPALLLVLGGGFGYLLFGPEALFAQSTGNPPKITNITISSPTATSTTITWDTDLMSDSEVNYGLDKNYGIARDPFPNKKHHVVTVTDLEPSTVYHMRFGSQDELGNQALTGDYTVITKGVVHIKDIDKIPPEERATVERAVTAVQELKTVDGLKAVADAINVQARKIIEPPVIIGNARIEEVGSDYAIILWATDQNAGSIVHFSRETEYDPTRTNPYTTTEGDNSERVKDHHVRLEGLSPGTRYHFQVESEADLGMMGVSRDNIFTTKAIMPTITSFRIGKVEADSATLAWRTSVPASGVVEYTDTKTKEAKSIGSPIFATSHSVKIANLRLGARYSALVKAENEVGDKVTSNTLFFTTVKDVLPPEINKVNNESTLYPTADAKVQTIASWTSDEPAYCQFLFRSGLDPTAAPTGLGEEKQPRTDHVQVIVDFLPSTVYQFWIECRDPSGNKAKSENFVLFTPNKEKSIIDIILENFQGTFGWVKNIGK